MSLKTRARSGQSLIEFIFVVVIFLNLLVVTFNAIVGFCVQQYFAYATFMSARAFQAAAQTPSLQRSKAEAQLLKYIAGPDGQVGRFSVPNFRLLATNITYQLPDPNRLPYRTLPPDPGSGRQVSVYFEVPLFQLPFGALSETFPTIRMQTSSYLGRESTRSECFSWFQNFYQHYVPNDPRVTTLEMAPVRNGWTSMDDNDC